MQLLGVLLIKCNKIDIFHEFPEYKEKEKIEQQQVQRQQEVPQQQQVPELFCHIMTHCKDV